MEYGMLKEDMAQKPPYATYNILNGTQLYTMEGESNEKASEFIEQSAKYNTDNIFMLPKQVKLFADGAIYSLAIEMKEGYTEGFKGQWITPLVLFEEQMNIYWDKGHKIHIHVNRDLGVERCLDITRKLMARNLRKNHRMTFHHLGYFTDDQAEEMKKLGIEASVKPYYLWALVDKYSEHGLGSDGPGTWYT